MSPSLVGTFRVAALALLWGSSFLWISLSLTALNPTQITLARLVLGTSIVFLVARQDVRKVLGRRDLYFPIVVAALLANVIPFTLFAVAQQTIASNVAGALNATTPVWALLVALSVGLQRRTNAAQVFGLLVGLAGTAIILSPWSGQSSVTGSLLALAAAASYGAGYVWIAARLTPAGLPSTALAAMQLLAATGLTTLLVPITGLEPISITPLGLVAVVMLGAGGTGLAYWLLYRIIQDDGPVAASTVTYLLPAVSIALGALVLDEPITRSLFAGSLLVIVGVLLARRDRFTLSRDGKVARS